MTATIPLALAEAACQLEIVVDHVRIKGKLGLRVSDEEFLAVKEATAVFVRERRKWRMS